MDRLILNFFVPLYIQTEKSSDEESSEGEEKPERKVRCNKFHAFVRGDSSGASWGWETPYQ